MTRILIADPDSASRKALALLLTRKLSVESVYEAADTDSLLRQALSATPDILLLDDSLSGLSYPETCQQLREALPALTIALLSVDECACDKAFAYQAEFIYKGASVEQTLVRLAKLIEGQK